MLLLVAACTAFIILLAPKLAAQGAKLAQQLPETLENISQTTNSLDWLKELVKSKDSASFIAAGKITGEFFGIFANTLDIVSSLFVILFVGLYLCFTPQYYVNGFLRLFPLNWRGRGHEIFQALNHILGRWLIGRFVGMLLVGLLTFLGLLFFGVTLPLGLAVLAGLLTFIPYLGPIISAVPAVLLGYMQSLTTGLYVCVGIGHIQADALTKTNLVPKN